MTNAALLAAMRAETAAGLRALFRAEPSPDPARWRALADEANKRLDALGVPEVVRC